MLKKSIHILILLSGLAFAQEETPASIAVAPLVPNGMSETEAASLTNALRTELGNTGKYQVLERTQMEEILNEQGFQQTGACDNTSCAMQIGQLLAVEYMVLGDIGKVGRTFVFNVRIVEVKSGRIVNDITENYKGVEDYLLTKVVPMAAQKLAGTYKKDRRGLLPAGITTAIAVAVAIPVIILLKKDEEETPQQSFELGLQW